MQAPRAAACKDAHVNLAVNSVRQFFIGASSTCTMQRFLHKQRQRQRRFRLSAYYIYARPSALKYRSSAHLQSPSDV